LLIIHPKPLKAYNSVFSRTIRHIFFRHNSNRGTTYSAEESTIFSTLPKKWQPFPFNKTRTSGLFPGFSRYSLFLKNTLYQPFSFFCKPYPTSRDGLSVEHGRVWVCGLRVRHASIVIRYAHPSGRTELRALLRCATFLRGYSGVECLRECWMGTAKWFSRSNDRSHGVW
jgi:hypothetical protein